MNISFDVLSSPFAKVTAGVVGLFRDVPEPQSPTAHTSPLHFLAFPFFDRFPLQTLSAPVAAVAMRN